MPGKVPPGYLGWLKKQEPQIAFDASQLKTEAVWVKAGEIVFHAPIASQVVTQTPARFLGTAHRTSDPERQRARAVPAVFLLLPLSSFIS